MKHALVETDMGWAAIGIEDGKVCAAALPTTRELAEFAIADWGADEPASKEESALFVSLVLRAVAGEDVRLDGNVQIGVGTGFEATSPWNPEHVRRLRGQTSDGFLDCDPASIPSPVREDVRRHAGIADACDMSPRIPEAHEHPGMHEHFFDRPAQLIRAAGGE